MTKTIFSQKEEEVTHFYTFTGPLKLSIWHFTAHWLFCWTTLISWHLIDYWHSSLCVTVDWKKGIEKVMSIWFDGLTFLTLIIVLINALNQTILDVNHFFFFIFFSSVLRLNGWTRLIPVVENTPYSFLTLCFKSETHFVV